MTTVTTGTAGDAGNDINQQAMEAIAAAPVTSHSATKVVLDLGNGKSAAFIGTGFGGFNEAGLPTTGTVSQIAVELNGVIQTNFTDFSIAFNTLFGLFQNGDVNGYYTALFSGNDTFVSHNDSTAGEQGESFVGGDGKDVFDMVHSATGAAVQISAGDGNDTVKYAGNFDAATDQIDGGSGIDQLDLDGDYATIPIAFVGANLTGVEIINLAAGHSYNLVTADANVAAGTSLKINGLALTAGSTLVFNGDAETDGRFTIEGGGGNDTVTGGAGNDIFYMQAGGNDIAHGGGGNDLFVFKGAFTAQDQVDGGAGSNVISLDGDYSAGLTLLATTMVNIGKIELASGHSYNLTTNDANVTTAALTIDGHLLGTGDTLTFNGSAETTGKFVIDGGSGIDTLTGGEGNDHIDGGVGADHLNGGGGHDIFIYTHEGDSLGSANGGPAGSGFDTISNLDFALDKFDMWFTVTAVDAEVTSGQLRQPLFDTDLTNTLTSSVLGAHSAVLFTPTSGDYNGRMFLIVDNNGEAGYQAGDTVIDVTGAANLSHLTTASFI